MARYSLVMSDPRDLPPQPLTQMTEATGFEIPVPSRSEVLGNLDRICRSDHLGDDLGGGGGGGQAAPDQP